MIIIGHCRGPPPRSPCKALIRGKLPKLVMDRSEQFSFWGADPQIWGGVSAQHGRFCSACGVLPLGVEISANILKMTEILRGKNIWRHLAVKPRVARLQLGHSTVAAHEVYKPYKIGGPSSINGGDMVPFIFHRNP